MKTNLFGSEESSIARRSQASIMIGEGSLYSENRTEKSGRQKTVKIDTSNMHNLDDSYDESQKRTLGRSRTN